MGLKDLIVRLPHGTTQILRRAKDNVAWREAMRTLTESSELSFLDTLIPGCTLQAKRFLSDLRNDRDFFTQLNETHQRVLGSPIGKYQKWCHLVYVMVRLLRPRYFVETGVFHGWSAAFILKAMQENNYGELCSIDLPARSPIVGSTTAMNEATLPSGCDPGWIVPDHLRQRWVLKLGSSRDLLPAVLKERGTIDIFLHDSLHTTEYMLWEYQTVWPYLTQGGLLLSDDIFWNHAFRIFSMRVGRQKLHKHGWGALRK